jgi:hypothetical protein
MTPTCKPELRGGAHRLRSTTLNGHRRLRPRGAQRLRFYSEVPSLQLCSSERRACRGNTRCDTRCARARTRRPGKRPEGYHGLFLRLEQHCRRSSRGWLWLWARAGRHASHDAGWTSFSRTWCIAPCSCWFSGCTLHVRAWGTTLGSTGCALCLVSV